MHEILRPGTNLAPPSTQANGVASHDARGWRTCAQYDSQLSTPATAAVARGAAGERSDRLAALSGVGGAEAPPRTQAPDPSLALAICVAPYDRWAL